MIFGSDNRVKATESYELYNAVVQIVSYFPDGSLAQGSGVVVGANDILTAGHVVFDKDSGGFAKAISITPARDGQIKPFGVWSMATIDSTTKWRIDGEYSGDYAIIGTDREIGRFTGVVDVAAIPDDILSKKVYSLGYPGDISGGESMQYTDGTPDSKNENELWFYDDFDAKQGQSGSGVFVDIGGESKAIGVVSYEHTMGGSSYNSVVGFDSIQLAEIESWIEGNDESLSLYPSYPKADRAVIERADLMFYAFLGRGGDRETIDFLVDKFKNGTTLSEIVDLFYTSGEYRASAFSKYDDTRWVEYVFSEVLRSKYTQSDVSHWVEVLKNSQNKDKTKAEILYMCSTLDVFENRLALNVYNDWHKMYDYWELEAFGSNDSDIITAKGGDSVLMGYGGDDSLKGGSGDDYIWGGSGRDTLEGGAGADFFAFGSGDGIDMVMDFELGVDFLRVRNSSEYKIEVGADGYLIVTDVSGTDGLKLVGITEKDAAAIIVIAGELI